MRRDPNTGLVKNEKLLLLALLEMGEPSIHPYALTQYWRQNPKARSLSYSTLYRCLDALEERGFVTSSRTEGASGGPTRRRYELTKAGSALAFQLQDMTDDRLGAPKPL